MSDEILKLIFILNRHSGCRFLDPTFCIRLLVTFVKNTFFLLFFRPFFIRVFLFLYFFSHLSNFKKILQTDSRFLSKVGILAKKPAHFVVHYYIFLNKWLLWYDAGRMYFRTYNCNCIFLHLLHFHDLINSIVHVELLKKKLVVFDFQLWIILNIYFKVLIEHV